MSIFTIINIIITVAIVGALLVKGQGKGLDRKIIIDPNNVIPGRKHLSRLLLLLSVVVVVGFNSIGRVTDRYGRSVKYILAMYLITFVLIGLCSYLLNKYKDK